MKNKVSKTFCVEVASGLILFLGIISYSSENFPRYINRLNMLLAMFIFFYYFCKRKFRLSDLLLLVGSFGLGLINLGVVHQQPLQNYLLFSGAYFAASLVLIKQERFFLPFWNVLTVITVVYIMWFWFHSVDGYLLFYGTSRNHISVYLIELLFVFVYVHRKNGHNISVLPYLIYFLCCIVAIGRMGIIVSGILLAGILAYRLFLRKGLSAWKKLFSIVVAIFGISAVAFFFARNGEAIIEKYFSRFVSNNSFSDQARMGIVTAYLEAIKSPKAFLLGANTHNISFLELWNANPHNSFFMIHASFGIVGLLAYLFSILITLRKLHRIQNDELSMILLAFAIRGLTDTVVCGQPGDIIVWFFLLYSLPIGSRRNYKRKWMENLKLEEIGI